ncbi:hypothetical protein MUA04_23285 [Enterobacteriaceae bacterium H11S18]|uniref:YicS family protein n=1 Tax=Dryocola clanedunensis TaxID=2925396 RepID=UPI0022EFF23C|nr:YicS family protein [Dryocola clanedunensis]MCT4706346.1 hypothetical protein [Dryocola clanedunensis]MCT4713096.1 hypothetical protein [Dryocola clanedunensis]
MGALRVTVLLFSCLFYINAQADSPFRDLQFGQNKLQILGDLKKICHTQKPMTDEALANKILSSDENKSHVRDARIALERNNQQNYWDALGKVECPEM